MVYEIIIPLAILVGPWLLVRYVFATPHTRDLPFSKHIGYILAAVALWLVALRMPEIPMPETDTFSMHMMGGVVAAVLFVYATKVYNLKWEAWWQAWVGLFFFVSTLGVVNELFELLLNRLNYPGMILGDERWDLLANTIGALVAFSVLQVFGRKK